MLVITRKNGQTVTITGPCKVIVVESRWGQVRLGFEADRSVDILRDDAKKGERNERLSQDR